MATATVRPRVPPPRGPTARFRLGVREWLVLRSTLLTALPGFPTPPDFTPQALGRDANEPLSESERRTAWETLIGRGLATTVPPRDDLDALLPPFAAGLLALTEASLCLDVRVWSAPAAMSWSIASCAQATLALVRTGDDEAAAVELIMASPGAVIEEVLGALPAAEAARPTPATPPAGPVIVDGTHSNTVAEGLRAGRELNPAHVPRLTAEVRSALGADAVTGGLQLGAYSGVTGSDPRAPELLISNGLWWWTNSYAVELVGAAGQKLAAQRLSFDSLHTRVVDELALLQADRHG